MQSPSIYRVVAQAAAQQEQSPQEKVENLQEESSGKLEEALDGVEENLDAQVCPKAPVLTLLEIQIT